MKDSHTFYLVVIVCFFIVAGLIRPFCEKKKHKIAEKSTFLPKKNHFFAQKKHFLTQILDVNLLFSMIIQKYS